MTINGLKLKVHVIAGKLQSAWMGRRQEALADDLTFSQSAAIFPDRTRMYAYMHHYYHNLCPEHIRQHRSYFAKEFRGFGEEAFHAMWFTLLREFRPNKCLEIGVYRGQTISLWALIAKKIDYPIDIHGISPFTPAGDQVSDYLKHIDYKADTLENHRHFELPLPSLLRAFSTAPESKEYILSQKWNLIYIDGNHDYEIALSDYEICKDSLAVGGLLVMDDSSLYTDYSPRIFSFAGHPGPSRVVKERAIKDLQFVGGVGHNNIFRKN